MGDAEQALLKMSPVENAAVGVGAGTIEVIALQPILYWKNATQQGLPLSLNPRMLYRGLSTSVVNMATLTGLQFPLTGAVCEGDHGRRGAPTRRRREGRRRVLRRIHQRPRLRAL